MSKNEDIESTLAHKDIRPTSMRILVLRYLIEENKVTSLMDLENNFERADKSTLFRTLNIFEAKGLVHKIDDGTGVTKYGLCVDQCDCTIDYQHYHFHCTKCTETFCLKSLPLPEVELPRGFSVETANLVLKGRCPQCN